LPHLYVVLEAMKLLALSALGTLLALSPLS
jgi:hypothetical protein